MRCKSLYWLGMLVAGTAIAECPSVARVTRVDGDVAVRVMGSSGKPAPIAVPAALCAGDELHVLRGRALVNADGGDAVTVDSGSVLVIKRDGHAALNSGKALFDIQKRASGPELQVETRVSVIGVKGTRFLVSDRPEGVSVALDEGVVDVSSTKGKLGLYREKSQAPRERSFDDFKREMREGVSAEKKAFEEYKASIQKEFVAFVERVTMRAGTELTIANGEAVERDTSADVRNDLENLRRWQVQR